MAKKYDLSCLEKRDLLNEAAISLEYFALLGRAL